MKVHLFTRHTCVQAHPHTHTDARALRSPPSARIASVCSSRNALSCAALCSGRMGWSDREEIRREETHVTGTALLRCPLSEPPSRQGARAGWRAGGRGRGPAGGPAAWRGLHAGGPSAQGHRLSVSLLTGRGPACRLSSSLSRLAREAGKEESVFSWAPSKTRLGGEHRGRT